jgi:tRNA G10  N-methylase Trm11
MYLYTYACHEDEKELCELELRTLFGVQPAGRAFLVETAMDASRSPFIKERVQIRFEGADLAELVECVKAEGIEADTFKVVYVKTEAEVPYEERREAERFVGRVIRGTAEMRAPSVRFGIAKCEGRWWFGELTRNHSPWLTHNEKAQHYSTALSTRVARAVANIAVPRPEGVRAIDPCCGIGTVVLEALSMGIRMVGSDVNPLAVKGARENLNRFGYPNVIRFEDACMVMERYDAVVLDLPYNIASKLSDEERDGLLRAAYQLAGRAVIVSVESIDQALVDAGLRIEDRCVVRKGSFRREVFVCAHEF